MSSNISTGTRVVCVSDHAEQGKTGTVTAVNDDTIMVRMDGESMAWQWHVTHFAPAPSMCETCGGWRVVEVGSDVISQCSIHAACPDCVNGYANSGPNVTANIGRTVTRCRRTACYNQQNGRECWDATHSDGSMSYEWESMADATNASLHYRHRDLRIGVHRSKFC